MKLSRCGKLTPHSTGIPWYVSLPWRRTQKRLPDDPSYLWHPIWCRCALPRTFLASQADALVGSRLTTRDRLDQQPPFTWPSSATSLTYCPLSRKAVIDQEAAVQAALAAWKTPPPTQANWSPRLLTSLSWRQKKASQQLPRPRPLLNWRKKPARTPGRNLQEFFAITAANAATIQARTPYNFRNLISIARHSLWTYRDESSALCMNIYIDIYIYIYLVADMKYHFLVFVIPHLPWSIPRLPDVRVDPHLPWGIFRLMNIYIFIYIFGLLIWNTNSWYYYYHEGWVSRLGLYIYIYIYI